MNRSTLLAARRSHLCHDLPNRLARTRRMCRDEGFDCSSGTMAKAHSVSVNVEDDRVAHSDPQSLPHSSWNSHLTLACNLRSRFHGPHSLHCRLTFGNIASC